MIKKLIYLISPYEDAYINLAIENHLLNTIKSEEKILFFYKNTASIVLGRFQNPWLECNIAQMKKLGVNLVRRQSGGGTVYHDLENLNFCFIDAKREFDKTENNNLIIKALKTLGIEAYASDRSDLRLKYQGVDYKFSGSAFKQKKDCSFHHGTLLINSELDILNEILKSKQQIEKTKSIASVRSKVLNLKEINSKLTSDMLSSAIANTFKSHLDLELQKWDCIPDMVDQDFLQKMRSWQWVYGETPKFCLVQDDLELEAKKGKLIDLNIERLNFHPILEAEVKKQLSGQYLKTEVLFSIFESLTETFKQEATELNGLRDLLVATQCFTD